MRLKVFCLGFVFLFASHIFSFAQTKKYDRFEYRFTSSKEYENPIYEVGVFDITFTSPSGRMKTVRGFWDGGTTWKVRFMPDEIGTWTFHTISSALQ